MENKKRESQRPKESYEISSTLYNSDRFDSLYSFIIDNAPGKDQNGNYINGHIDDIIARLKMGKKHYKSVFPEVEILTNQLKNIYPEGTPEDMIAEELREIWRFQRNSEKTQIIPYLKSNPKEGIEAYIEEYNLSIQDILIAQKLVDKKENAEEKASERKEEFHIFKIAGKIKKLQDEFKERLNLLDFFGSDEVKIYSEGLDLEEMLRNNNLYKYLPAIMCVINTPLEGSLDIDSKFVGDDALYSHKKITIDTFFKAKTIEERKQYLFETIALAISEFKEKNKVASTKKEISRIIFWEKEE